MTLGSCKRHFYVHPNFTNDHRPPRRTSLPHSASYTCDSCRECLVRAGTRYARCDARSLPCLWDLGSEVYVGCTNGELLRYALQAEPDSTKVGQPSMCQLRHVTLRRSCSKNPTPCSHVRVFRVENPSMNSSSSLICPAC